MSYILDALQRAEAERERGSVPGLNARPVPPSTAPTAFSARQRAAFATVVVAILGAVAAGLWAWHSPVAVPVPVPVPAPAPQGQAAPATTTPPVVPQTVTALAPPPVADAVAPRPAPPVSAMATVAKPKTPPVSASEKSAATSDSAASPALLAELPQGIRQQIPALTINGAVYSDNPAQRLLLVNGQVLSQGALVAPDLTLERIGANTSEFSFRGTRFRLAH